MSIEFITFLFISGLACLLSASVVRWRNIKDPSRLVGWYFGVFILTYLIRPAGTQIVGDTFLYRWFCISDFEQIWKAITAAAVLSVLSFATGYRLTERKSKSEDSKFPNIVNANMPCRRQVILVAVILLVWGYFSTFISNIIGGYTTGGIANVDIGFGVAQGNTLWLITSDLFVSTGSVILYIVTGHLFHSIIPTIPWLAQRVMYGYGRINIIAHFVALLAVWLVRNRWLQKKRVAKKTQVLSILAALLIIIFLIFPATKISRSWFAEDSSIQGLKTIWSLNFDPMIWLSTTSDISGFETTLYHLEVSKRSVLGTYYLYSYFLKPIPRILWPDKPYPSTLAEKWLGIETEPCFFGFASGSIGMAFQQWGWIGIIFEFLFTGWFFRRIENWVRHRPNISYALLAYAGFFSLLPQLGRDSLLFMIADRWLFVYGIPVFLLWLIHKHAIPNKN